MNVVVLIGRLAGDPEIKYSQNQMAIAKFTLAVERYIKDRDNETDWIRITAFGRQAELAESYLKKGIKVAINGSIKTGSYEDKDGKTVYTTDVIATKIEFVEKKDKKEQDSKGFSSMDDDKAPPF